jgi:hypothetical protein
MKNQINLIKTIIGFISIMGIFFTITSNIILQTKDLSNEHTSILAEAFIFMNITFTFLVLLPAVFGKPKNLFAFIFAIIGFCVLGAIITHILFLICLINWQFNVLIALFLIIINIVATNVANKFITKVFQN